MRFYITIPVIMGNLADPAAAVSPSGNASLDLVIQRAIVAVMPSSRCRRSGRVRVKGGCREQNKLGHSEVEGLDGIRANAKLLGPWMYFRLRPAREPI